MTPAPTTHGQSSKKSTAIRTDTGTVPGGRPPSGRHPWATALLAATTLLACCTTTATWSASETPNTATAKASWPTRPLRIVVGFPAGSSPDLTARAIAEPLAQALGQPVFVDNKPGAAGNLAADAVAKSTDGHTVGLMINGNLTTARLINPKTPYDPRTDLAPVSLIASAPLVLATTPALAALPSGFNAAAKVGGNHWNYGSPGIGTIAHVGMELLKSRAGWAAVHVPYAGNPQVITALLGGQVHMALLPPGLVNAQMRAGKLTGLAVTSSVRSTLAPELPSLQEWGITGTQLDIWNAVAAPRSMSAAHIARLSDLISTIVRTPDMRQRLFAQGWQVIGSSPEGLAIRMRADTANLGKIITDLNITTD
jgi:tripartite-type tricarboxylate transporter receptor subunit TctC